MIKTTSIMICDGCGDVIPPDESFYGDDVLDGKYHFCTYCDEKWSCTSCMVEDNTGITVPNEEHACWEDGWATITKDEDSWITVHEKLCDRMECQIVDRFNQEEINNQVQS